MKSLLFVAAGRIKICKFLIVFDFSYPFLISLESGVGVRYAGYSKTSFLEAALKAFSMAIFLSLLQLKLSRMGHVHFAVTFLDCWRTSFCVTTIIKILNNNAKDKQTSGVSLALDEDSPFTNSCLFTLDRLPLLLLLRKN